MQTATKTGTPTGRLQLQIYAGTSGTLSLLGTTDPVPSFNNAGYPVTACFQSPVIVPGNTTIRVVMSDTSSSDTSANAYRTYYFTYDGSAGSPALTPVWRNSAGNLLSFNRRLHYGVSLDADE
jgi:hypothetical protein